METFEAERDKLARLLCKPEPFDRGDLQFLRRFSILFHQHYVGSISQAQARLSVEMIEATTGLAEILRAVDTSMNRLNDSSTNLVTETNRLTRRILWLTIVGVFIALIGTAVAVIQLLNSQT